MSTLFPEAGYQTPLESLEESEVQSVVEVERKTGPTQELGLTGLRRTGGYIDEEFLPQLRGRKAVQIYREMSDNEPLIGALLFTIQNLLRNVEWRVVPGGKTTDDANAAKLLETCIEDMEHSWNGFIIEALSMLTYGWSLHEVVYKRRVGMWEKDPRKKSKYTDGLFGWRKLPIRSQDTLFRWVFASNGDTEAMIQMSPPSYKQVLLPLSRCVLLRYQHSKGNPEGVSMLRNAYRPWYMKKRIEEFESVGVERDLAGLPVAKVPAEYLRAKQGTQQAEVVNGFRKMIRSLRRNEQEGVVFPIAYDQDTKQPLYSLELLGSGGSRNFQTDAIIQRYEQRILMTVLADFIMVGHEQVGSYSMHIDKTGIFRAALNGILKSIARSMEQQLIPKLFLVNGWKPANLPTLEPANVDNPDLTQLGGFMTQMAQLGMNWFPDADLEKFLRAAAALPSLPDEEYEKRQAEQRQAEATRYAQNTAEYLQARMAAQDPEKAMQMQQGAQGAQGGQGAKPAPKR